MRASATGIVQILVKAANQAAAHRLAALTPDGPRRPA
jgi:hypothetical protein